MSNEKLVQIAEKFAHSGWDLIAEPAKQWLEAKAMGGELGAATDALICAVKQADAECGSCGCEFDPLYKEFLEKLRRDENECISGN
ncbi:MAG: hypothetical protein ACOYEU_11225 [Limnochordia bacterium]